MDTDDFYHFETYAGQLVGPLKQEHIDRLHGEVEYLKQFSDRISKVFHLDNSSHSVVLMDGKRFIAYGQRGNPDKLNAVVAHRSKRPSKVFDRLDPGRLAVP